MQSVKSFRCRLMRLQDAHTIFKREFHRKNSFYDALGITPKATQADIKNAFYKLSKEFHPDKSTGNDVKFKEISAAYEVLGNLKLRKLYDSGMLPAGAGNAQEAETDDESRESRFSQQYPNNMRESFKRGPMSGRTSAYNYDEWARAHYAETFIRNDKFRSRWANKQAYNEMKNAQARAETVLWMFGGLMFSLMFYNAALQRDWDTPSKRPEPEADEN